jgi:hypothetical protein
MAFSGRGQRSLDARVSRKVFERTSRPSNFTTNENVCSANWARMSMVDGFPYKEEVGGSSPSAPTSSDFGLVISDCGLADDLKSEIDIEKVFAES